MQHIEWIPLMKITEYESNILNQITKLNANQNALWDG